MEHAQGTDGLSLFYTDLDRTRVHVREIEKLGRKAVDSNELFIDGLEVPVADRIGEEGKGFSYILHGLNPERVLLAADATGLDRKSLVSGKGGPVRVDLGGRRTIKRKKVTQQSHIPHTQLKLQIT